MADLPDDQNQPAPPVSPTTPVSGGTAAKEKDKPAFAEGSGEARQEVTPITEYTRQVDLEPEVESWMEKLEKEEGKLTQPVTDDKGQVILDDAQKQAGFKVVLPLTKDEVDQGLRLKVIDSLRWLAEWCLRLIKMFGNKVAYRKA